MLKELHIKQFALIDDISIGLDNGLNVLTGETGAGKSLILRAIELLLGAKGSPEEIQQGADSAIVEGIFELESFMQDFIKNKGITAEDTLLIKRIISNDGKNKVYINGEIASVSILKEIGKVLADFHGQHEQQSLLNQDNQRTLLDYFGNLQELSIKVGTSYKELEDLKLQYSHLNISEQERAQKVDLLEFQIKEIESAKLAIGEEEKLAEERIMLANAEKLVHLTNEAYELISGSETQEIGVSAKIAQTLSCLKQLAATDVNMSDLTESCSKAKLIIEEISYKLRDYKDKLEANPNRLEDIEARLDTITRLKRKYGSSITAILDFKNKAKAELELISTRNEQMEKLKVKIEEQQNKYLKLSKELTKKRQSAAKLLNKEVEEQLKEIAMQNVIFEVAVKPIEELTAYGIDEVEFLISPNAGEVPKPLAKIASGGEISRVMLALKVILAEADKIPLLIFDEIDSGIGGRIGKIIGKKLKQVSKSHQVICVTHLAQIASFASTHFNISKYTASGKTRVNVELLNNKEQIINELAKMLGGEKTTQVALEHAKELLYSATGEKKK